jgi:DNA repair protein RadC
MRYCIRTITWRFKESIELDQDLANKKSITIRSPADVFENYQSLFKDQVRERFIVFWLNSANKVVGFEVISEGFLTVPHAST